MGLGGWQGHKLGVYYHCQGEMIEVSVNMMIRRVDRIITTFSLFQKVFTSVFPGLSFGSILSKCLINE